MLVSLRIKNLALVEDLSLELGKGFNAITGETGAGKSILMGALDLALGERADRDLIRTGTDSCAVEALFDAAGVDALAPQLEELGLEPCSDGQLIVKRVFSASGANRQFVNGSPSTLQALKRIGELLVDMHGPHEHQSLLRTEAQLRILDRFAGLEKQRADFGAGLRKLRELEERKRALVMDEAEFRRRVDLLQHQANEIDAARLSPDEEETIEADYRMASSAQKLLDLIGRTQDALFEGEGAALSRVAQAQRALRDLAAIDARAAALAEANENIHSQMQELNREVSHYASRVELDPDRLQFLSDRLTLIQGLKRKYGGSIAGVIDFGKNARKELQTLEGREEELARLNGEMDKERAALEKRGAELRRARVKAIPDLVKDAVSHLKDLGFLQSRFDVVLSEAEPSASGMDAIEFQFAPNPGEPLKPLREIASSGEMARVMLAIKTALAGQDEVPVLVFDEVDANVGGEVGNRVGEKMSRIGKRHQVICITHLPQVASHGDSHQVVVKWVENGRTYTRLEKLDAGKRAAEIARMLGGRTETALQHAREMLQLAAKSPKSASPRRKIKS